MNGETIVETPEDAIESFLYMGIDYLAIGPFLISYKENIKLENTSKRRIIRKQEISIQKNYSVPENFYGHSMNLSKPDSLYCKIKLIYIRCNQMITLIKKRSDIKMQ